MGKMDALAVGCMNALSSRAAPSQPNLILVPLS
jgi:hypothetical protein